MKKYRCPDCGQIVERDSNKKQIKSYCSVTGKTVKLKRLKRINTFKRTGMNKFRQKDMIRFYFVGAFVGFCIGMILMHLIYKTW